MTTRKQTSVTTPWYQLLHWNIFENFVHFGIEKITTTEWCDTIPNTRFFQNTKGSNWKCTDFLVDFQLQENTQVSSWGASCHEHSIQQPQTHSTGLQQSCCRKFKMWQDCSKLCCTGWLPLNASVCVQFARCNTVNYFLEEYFGEHLGQCFLCNSQKRSTSTETTPLCQSIKSAHFLL